MPLKSGYSHQTFAANLATLKRTGLDHNNAVMSAASYARKSFFKRFPQGALPNWLAFPKAARLAQYYDGSGRPLPHAIQSNPADSDDAYYLSYAPVIMPQIRKAIEAGGGWAQMKGLPGGADMIYALIDAGMLEEDGGFVREPAKKNPVARQPPQAALAQATRLYEGFTGKPPRKLHKIAVPPLPETALAIGKVFGIMYTVDATGERFHHEFKDSARPLLIVSSDGRQVFLHGGAYTFTQRGFVDKRK